VRDTGAHVDEEQRLQGAAVASSLRSAFVRGTVGDRVLRACSQAGLVNNLNDALAWGLAPLYLAANGASVAEVGIVAAVYPAVWGAGQLATGALSDRTGRKPLITTGMLVQAGALILLVAGGGQFVPALGAAILLGVGTALVYPTLIAAVSDLAQPVDRAQLVGVYRFWRDFGFVVGALLAGVVADAFGGGAAIAVVAALTAGSGIWVAMTRWGARPAPLRKSAAELLADAQRRIAPRLEPTDAFEEVRHGAALVDLRSNDERQREGIIPDSIHIPRSVLEWRLDPDSGYSNPFLRLDQRVIVFCAHGFSSSFAAATLRELGCRTSTDIVGGFAAWKAAGLPVLDAGEDDELDESQLPGMGPPARSGNDKEARWLST
jgi:MFS family permease